MKIHESRREPVAQKKAPFSHALGAAKAKGRAAPRVLSPAAAARAAGSIHALREIRRAQDARGAQLVSDRSEGLANNAERTKQRREDLLLGEVRRELGREEGRAEHPRLEQPPRTEPLPRDEPLASASGPSAQVQQARAPEAAGRATGADSLLELVERIDSMVKAGRPALAVSVGGGLDAEVEVQRTGKDEVALTLVGRRGAVDARVLSQIREALGARGLRLSALRAG